MTALIPYSGNPSSRFDRTYYRERHIPLVMQSWAQDGLLSLAALYPENSEKTLSLFAYASFGMTTLRRRHSSRPKLPASGPT